jgi:hypothetical protein
MLAVIDGRGKPGGQCRAASNQRDGRAGEREREADRREADERERELDERGRALGWAVETLEQRTLETIERSRALLGYDVERLNREETAARRATERRARQQAQINRASAESERGLAAWQPDPGVQVKRAQELRRQARTAIEAFSATEEQIARLHDELAASRPERRDEFRRTAEQARQVARQAREAPRAFTE